MNKTDLNKLPKQQLISIIETLTKDKRGSASQTGHGIGGAPVAKSPTPKAATPGARGQVQVPIVVERQTNAEMGEHFVVKAPFSAGFNQTCNLYLRDGEGKALSKFDRQAGVRRVPLHAEEQLKTALNEVWGWAGRTCLFDGQAFVLTPSTDPRQNG